MNETRKRSLVLFQDIAHISPDEIKTIKSSVKMNRALTAYQLSQPNPWPKVLY
jgi:hypothetical protein